ncbi:hypothetical protein DBR28_14545 [Chryseobacterium sp. HMWF028]|nr:hypothetical protein DBR28_14545 [Chryseobacterium sp. HMWF028]
MKDKWFVGLKNKIEGHEDDPPDGLWESIENNLFPEEENNLFPLSPDSNKQNQKSGQSDKERRIRRLVTTLSVAAGVALLISILFFYNAESNPVNKDLVVKKKQDNTFIAPLGSKNPIVFSINVYKEDLGHDDQKMGSDKRTLLESTAGIVHNADDIMGNITSAITGIKMVPPVEPYNRPEKVISFSSPDAVFVPSLHTGTDVADSLSVLYPKENVLAKTEIDVKEMHIRRSLNQKWSLGLIFGQPTSNSSQQFQGYVMINGDDLKIPVGSDPETGTDDPLSDIVAGNVNEEVKTDIRHRLPVKLGLSASYRLNDKWSITTGITYSKLSSDLFSGTNANMIKGEQTIKYIGVPLQINYSIWQKGKLSTYAGAGAQIEKSISGKMKTNYIVNHEVKESVTEKLAVNSLQTSVNTGFGIQYKAFRNFGIYFEPGLRYNFKDGSDIRTIYKEKPLNLNLEFGLRYSIR